MVKSSPTRRRRRQTVDTSCVVAYLRCSTAEQAASGLGLEAQRQAIETEARRRGWTVRSWHSDEGVSGTLPPERRPGLADALAAVEECGAAVLVAAKLDRLTRSLGDLCALMARANAGGWSLAAADGTLDTSTPIGRAMTHMAGAFAQLERDLIATRTADALAVKKAQGVRLGRPSALPLDVRADVLRMREDGATYAAIADAMNAAGVPTATGLSRWTAPTASRAVQTAKLDQPNVA